MKSNKILSGASIIVTTIVLTLIGCTTTTSMPTAIGEAITIVHTGTATLAPATETSFPASETPSATPTLTPTPTSTPTATSTAQPTATETPYAIPTPPGEDADAQVLWLYETNNGCPLPCWWGIVPGQTEWEAAERILTIFDSNIYEASASGIDYYNPTIPLPAEVFKSEQVSPIYTVQNGIVEKIETLVSIGDTPPGYLAQYNLSSFLTTYGQPTEIWLSTYRSVFEEGDLPFFAVLLYRDHGIVAVYDDNGERIGDFVRGCPQVDPLSYLVLTLPGLNQTFEETISESSGLKEKDYLSLEEATVMDVMTFYKIFKNPDNTTCLETPANLWR